MELYHKLELITKVNHTILQIYVQGIVQDNLLQYKNLNKCDQLIYSFFGTLPPFRISYYSWYTFDIRGSTLTRFTFSFRVSTEVGTIDPAIFPRRLASLSTAACKFCM